MKDRNKYIGLGIIIIVIGIIVTVIVATKSASNDVKQYQELQQSVSDTEAIQEETQNYIDTFNEQNQQEYDDLDEQLDF
ncbi:MAG: hypothetical protein IKR70_01785 [Lachnospiraceae bacterium]|nr:hypothetical protein [Lachnospiraceae bacterium]